MATASDDISAPTPDQLAPILQRIGLSPARTVTRLVGGSNAVFRLDLIDGQRINLKTYDELRAKAPVREQRAADWLAAAGVEATRYLLVDETRTVLPYRFALVSFLPGETIDALKARFDLTQAYRQMGALLKRIHAVQMPAYGSFDDDGRPGPHISNMAFVEDWTAMALDSFRQQGGDAALADRLQRAIADNIDVAGHSRGAVFAHDDFQPANVLAEADGAGVSVSGVIDFGNARAADPIWDLAKAMFCTEHMAPGAGALLREGYGPIDHPEPERALWLYLLLHRVTMWFWLRHIGVIAPGEHNALIDDLVAMLAEPPPGRTRG